MDDDTDLADRTIAEPTATCRRSTHRVAHAVLVAVHEPASQANAGAHAVGTDVVAESGGVTEEEGERREGEKGIGQVVLALCRVADGDYTKQTAPNTVAGPHSLQCLCSVLKRKTQPTRYKER